MKIFDSESLENKKIWHYNENESPEDDGIKPLMETEKDINVSDVIVINNIAYSINVKHFKPLYVIAEKLKNQDFIKENEPEKQNYTNNIICPYCGYEDMDSWECSDSEDEEICGNCGSTFSYERIVTVEYNSYPVKKADYVRLRGAM